jgi:hypothetical protein
MADQEIREDEVHSFLGMSDEELREVDPNTLGQQAQSVEGDTEQQGDEEGGAAEGTTNDSGEDANDEQDEQDGSDAADAQGSDAGDAGEPDSEDAGDVVEGEGQDQPVTEQQKPEDKPKEDSGIDYKAEYEKLLAPFKANCRDMTVESVEDAKALMQMGANYNKKMAALKPSLKILKLLENNGLLSEEKLSYLIDLDKKDPAAISKLVKDSGMDPLDMSTDDKVEYTPKKYAVDDAEIELDTVLDELQGTPTYTRTLDVVSNKWDGPSKQVIANSPQILKVINNHMQSGIYDLIQTEVERERMFGRLNGLSDIEAYRQVGDAIQARGGFDHLGRQGQQTQTPPKVITPKPKVAEDDKLKDKRRAASSTKPAGPSKTVAEFNPLALSDEEFSKQVNSKFL